MAISRNFKCQRLKSPGAVTILQSLPYYGSLNTPTAQLTRNKYKNKNNKNFVKLMYALMISNWNIYMLFTCVLFAHSDSERYRKMWYWFFHMKICASLLCLCTNIVSHRLSLTGPGLLSRHYRRWHPKLIMDMQTCMFLYVELLSSQSFPFLVYIFIFCVPGKE